MEHRNIASIAGENMILCNTDNSATTEYTISELGKLHGKALRISMDVDAIVIPQQVPSAEPTVVIETSAESERARKRRGPYRRCTAHQIEQLFDYVIEQGKTAKHAAVLTGINIRTAQHCIKKYNDDEVRRLPVCGRKPGAGRMAKLVACHSHLLIDPVDERPAATLSNIRRALREAFLVLSRSNIRTT